jgi:hypothetical protein
LVRYNKIKWDLKQLRALLEKLGSMLMRQGWQRILVDMRHIEPLTAAEKSFLVQEWYGRKITRPSYLCTCYVLAENALARLSVHDMQEVARQYNVSIAFSTLEEAQTYLLTLPV